MRDYYLSSKKLVLAIKKYPCLYDFDSIDYYSRKICAETWQRVAEETGSSPASCRRTWRNLRIVFTRHLKRPFQDKKYYLLDDMKFLSPYIVNHNSNAQISVTPPLLQGRSDKTQDNSENNAVDNTVDNGSTIDISDSSISESSDELDERSLDNIAMAKPLPLTPMENVNLAEPRKQHQDDQFTDTILKKAKLDASSQKLHIENVQSFKPQEPDNVKRMFLLSLLPDLEHMTDHQMRKFRTRVSILIAEILDSDTSYKNRNVRPIFSMSSNNTGVLPNQNFRPMPNVSLDDNIRRVHPEGNATTNTGFFTYSLPIRTDNPSQVGPYNFNNSQNLTGKNCK